MAEKRMLAKTVIEHDNFVALPPAAQALYMHLTLSADDDGFCSQISTALFRAHAKKKDLDALVAARYLIRFPSGVIVIKHWRMANTNRADRYTPTVYQDEYQRLTVKQNKAYTLADNGIPNGNQTATNGQPNDATPLPQKRIEENRREEKRREENNTRDISHTRRVREDEEDAVFNAFWAAYPRKTGDIRSTYLEYLKALDSGVTPEALLEALKLHAEAWREEGDPQFIPSPKKWLENRRWEETPIRKAPKGKLAQQKAMYAEVTDIDMAELERLKNLI